MDNTTATKPMEDSAKIYTPYLLPLYDWWVLGLSNSWAWKCPTQSILLPFYQRHLANSEYHLDVGAGTGYYPAQVLDPTSTTKASVKGITLLDINDNTLVTASKRLTDIGYKGTVGTVNHNIFEPFAEGSENRGKFDSISLFYVFHCLPGSFPTKAENVAKNMASGLTEGGVLYGSTILVKGREQEAHNWFGQKLMNVYNSKGVFGNLNDEEQGLREGLEAVFEEVEIDVVGMVAMFVCKRPKV